MKQDTIKASRFLYTARFYDYSRIKITTLSFTLCGHLCVWWR